MQIYELFIIQNSSWYKKTTGKYDRQTWNNQIRRKGVQTLAGMNHCKYTDFL